MSAPAIDPKASPQEAAAVPDLLRVTTEYQEVEDRLRLSGELPDGSTIVLWLTQRLVGRLVPHLCGWLEKQTKAGAPVDLVQGFAQQAALASLESQPRVEAGSGSQTWLVQSIDLTAGEGFLVLVFKPDPQGAAVTRLTLQVQPLRQWLGIVLSQFRRAGWPLAVWPDWVLEARAPKTAPAASLH